LSDFVRILLDADYLMKRINLGKERTEIEGFKSWFDLLGQREDSVGERSNRMWLAPLSAAVGDVLETRMGEGEVVYFESEVQVLTELAERLPPPSLKVCRERGCAFRLDHSQHHD